MELTPEGTIIGEMIRQTSLVCPQSSTWLQGSGLQRDALDETSKTAVDLVGDDPKSTN